MSESATSTAKALVTLLFPVLVFFAGSWVTSIVSGRQPATMVLGQTGTAKDSKPLGQRLGYDVAAVAGYWKSLGDAGQRVEQIFLEIDLLFPFLYGGAFAAALLVAWRHLDRPFPAIWFLLPVAITMVADWTENLVQIEQLTRYMNAGQRALQPAWVQVASTATTLKLVFGFGSLVLLFALVAIWVARALRSA